MSVSVSVATRWTFSLSALAFGLAHLTGVQAVAALVPRWLPGGGSFWAVVTGIAFVLAGVAMLRLELLDQGCPGCSLEQSFFRRANPLRGPAPIVAVALVALVACKGPPARLVVGYADTVLVNNLGPAQVPVEVLDAGGHALPDTGVRFHWQGGVAVPVSSRGVVTCPGAGDATLRVSLGSLSTSVLLRCRPVHAVTGGGLVNLVLHGPPFDLSFAAVDSAGRPVRLLNAGVSVADTTILAREGWRIRARAPGASGVDVSVGDSSVHWSVFVYEPALTFADIRLGQLRAVPVRLAAGEQRSWPLPASPKTYWVQVLAQRDTMRLPRLTISGANCIDQGPLGYECLARHGASVIASHPRQVDPAREWSGTITVLRRDRP